MINCFVSFVAFVLISLIGHREIWMTFQMLHSVWKSKEKQRISIHFNREKNIIIIDADGD